MKFTRSLALAAAAAFAMTMTACDDDSTSSDPVADGVIESSLWAGTQASDYGSFISVREDTVFNQAAAQNNWAKIDLVFFQDTTAAGANRPTLFAPARAAVKFAHLSTMNVKNDTKLYPLSGVTFADITDAEALDAAIAKVVVTTQVTELPITEGLVFAVFLANGTKVVAQAKDVVEVDVSNVARKKINLELRIVQ